MLSFNLNSNYYTIQIGQPLQGHQPLAVGIPAQTNTAAHYNGMHKFANQPDTVNQTTIADPNDMHDIQEQGLKYRYRSGQLGSVT